MPGPILKVSALATKAEQTRDFFVVGGPVQADRACYIRREADEQLLEAIAAQRFVCVLAPRAVGKSSLMGRAIRRLRADGQLAAVVDLSQIGSRSESVDSARWHYSIAYRIVRELRLKVDLQAWWQDKSLLLNEQRLVEFFWDIVLPNTAAPVTIFFDDAERAADLPFANELFTALQGCRMRRVSEPEFARLNFVVLGAAAPEQLCADPGDSPFVDARAIELREFTREQCKALAAGFGFDAAATDSLLESIYGWTRGQPYWTQKLARAVSRKSGQLRTVDVSVQELFLAPGVSQSEPLLNHMHRLLTGSSPRTRQALGILGRLSKGAEVLDDPASAGQRLLRIAGLIGSDDNGMLRFRNRIVEQVFGSGPVRAKEPPRWRRPALIATAAALLVLLPLWYTLILPKPYVDYLSVVSRDPDLAQEAHARLSRFPGFRGRADRLLAEAMVRHSEEATTLDDLLAADAVLRVLPGRAALADELKARYWLRSAQTAARNGQRDLALVQALAAATGGLDEARPLAAELIDRDYLALERSYPLLVAPLAFAVDWQSNAVVIVDDTHRISRLPIDAGGSARSVTPADGASIASRLTALQHVGVSRGLSVDATGRAGAFQLHLELEHARPSDLLVRLRAPSGVFVEFELPPREGGFEQYDLSAAGNGVLARLANESVTGHWQLTLLDRRQGDVGALLGWELRFPGLPQGWPDDLIAGVPLQDPNRTEQVDVVLAPGGERAVAIPSRSGAGGALSVWDLNTGELIFDLPIAAPPAAIELVSNDRLLTIGAGVASLWQVGNLEPVLELRPERELFGVPAIDPAGNYFALGEQRADGRVDIGVYRARDGERVAQFESDPWADWLLLKDAAAVVTIDGSRRGVVIAPESGERVLEFVHEHELRRLVASPAADRVVAVDSDGEVMVWRLTEPADAVATIPSVYVGTTAEPGSVDARSTAATVSFVSSNGLIRVRSLSDGREIAIVEHGRGRDTRTRISPDGKRLVSVSDTMVRAWQLGPTELEGDDLGNLSAVALDPAGEFAAFGYRSGEVGWIEALSTASATLGSDIEHRVVVTSVAVDQGRRLVASGDSNGAIRIWDTSTGVAREYVLSHPSGPIRALALSADGEWLVSAGPSSARVWSLATGMPVNEIEVDGAPLAVAFAREGSHVAVSDSAGNIFLARPGVDDLRAVRSLSAVTALAFADADEARLASGARDGTLMQWDAATATQLAPARNFFHPIRWLDWSGSRDSVAIVSGSWLHQIEQASTPDAVVAGSRLLPAALRDAGAFTRVGDAEFLGFAIGGGGLLTRVGIDLGGEPGAAPDIPERDWVRVLGRALDTESGAIVIPGL